MQLTGSAVHLTTDAYAKDEYILKGAMSELLLEAEQHLTWAQLTSLSYPYSK
jgi:hypothetical protein